MSTGGYAIPKKSPVSLKFQKISKNGPKSAIFRFLCIFSQNFKNLIFLGYGGHFWDTGDFLGDTVWPRWHRKIQPIFDFKRSTSCSRRALYNGDVFAALSEVNIGYISMKVMIRWGIRGIPGGYGGSRTLSTRRLKFSGYVVYYLKNKSWKFQLSN